MNIILFKNYKIVVMRICRIPKNIDNKLEEFVIKVLYIIVVIHLFIAIWTFGNPKIFNDVS